jgi:hypothetical protein
VELASLQQISAAVDARALKKLHRHHAHFPGKHPGENDAHSCWPDCAFNAVGFIKVFEHIALRLMTVSWGAITAISNILVTYWEIFLP